MARSPQTKTDRRFEIGRKERITLTTLHNRVLIISLLASVCWGTTARAAQPIIAPGESKDQTVAASYFAAASDIEDREQRNKRKWKKAWIATWVAFAAVNVLDAHSSAGRPELNPLLRGKDGKFSVGRAALIKAAIGGGFFGLQWWMTKTNPETNYFKSFTIATGAAAGGLGAIAVRNYRLESTSSSKAATPTYLAPSN